MNLPTKSVTCLLSLLAVTMARSAPIVTPYANDFSTDPSGDFTATSNYNGGGSGSIGWNSGNQSYQSTVTDSNFGQINTNWSTVDASNLDAANSNFFLSSSFTVTANSTAGGTASVGLGVSDSTNFPTFSPASYYVGRFTTLDALGGGTTGQLALYQSDGLSGISLATPVLLPNYTDGTTYDFSLSGVYTGSDLLLTFTVTDGITSQSLSANVISQPFSNLTNFGYQHQITNWVSNTVEFDNFSLSAVPEPSSVALLAIGCCAFSLGMTRRRAARMI